MLLSLRFLKRNAHHVYVFSESIFRTFQTVYDAEPKKSTEILFWFLLNLPNIHSWCETNTLPLNVQKCNVLYFGHQNSKCPYSIRGVNIVSADITRDLGVIIDSSLSFKQHIEDVARKARRLNGFIFRTFRSRDANVLLPVFKAVVRPCLEFATPVWNPHSAYGTQLLENVQKRFTRCIRGMGHVSYDERLSQLKLSPLTTRRVYFDLILVYKLLNGFAVANCPLVRRNHQQGTRGHSHTLSKPAVFKNTRKFFFTSRVVNAWNSLPEEVVSSRTVQTFKVRLNRLLR